MQQLAPDVRAKLSWNDSRWPADAENEYVTFSPRTVLARLTGPPPTGSAALGSGGTFQSSTEAVPAPPSVGATSTW
jgi:hypothetical protein